MRNQTRTFTLAASIAGCLVASPLFAQSQEEMTIAESTKVLNEVMAVQASRIPQAIMANAQGLVIVPGVVKGGFIVGVRHGNGLAIVRNEQGGWQAPVFLSLTGGSVGFQAGLQSIDVVLVFKTPRSVKGLMSGKFTIGADASAAAGPVGVQTAAATDVNLGAEIYSYSKSKGLFAGVALDGTALQIKQVETQAYYQAAAAAGTPVPPSAAALVGLVTKYTTAPDLVPPAAMVGTRPGATAQPAPSLAQPATTMGQPTIVASPTGQATAVPNLSATAGQAVANGEAAIRQQLDTAAKSMQSLLDENWKRYLALPAELFEGNTQPSVQSLQEAVTRFDAVASNPQYAALANRPEFQTTYQLLKSYLAIRTTETNGTLNLPAPPGQIPASPGAQPLRY